MIHHSTTKRVAQRLIAVLAIPAIIISLVVAVATTPTPTQAFALASGDPTTVSRTTPIPAELATTTINVEVHAFVGSEVDSAGNIVGNGRYDGWFAVILDDGTPLIDWFQTNGLYYDSVQIPAGHTANMHWDTQRNGSEQPYVIDPTLCNAGEGTRATTTDYRDIHMDRPESPRDAGRRSVEAFCGTVNVPVTTTSTTAVPSTTTSTTAVPTTMFPPTSMQRNPGPTTSVPTPTTAPPAPPTTTPEYTCPNNPSRTVEDLALCEIPVPTARG